MYGRLVTRQAYLMRVLHLVKMPSGGMWAYRQVRELVKLGVEIHVAVPPGGPLERLYRNAGATVHPAQFSIPLRQPHRWRSLFADLRDLVDHVQPDLIHSHFVGTTLTMRLALGRRHPIPRLFQVPGPLHLEHPFFRRAEIQTAGPRDAWIGSCQWTYDCYRGQGIAEDRIFLSYLGTDVDDFTRGSEQPLRTELGISRDTPVVGMVAFMYAPKRYLGQRRGLKGHEDLIDAIVLARHRFPGLLGVFVGGAWAGATGYEQQVRAYGAKRLGEAAHFLGTRSDVASLYPAFDVAAHPSHSENVGGAVESLLLRVPTVATTVGGFPDLVRDEETGWLVPPRSPERLAAAICDALGHRQQAEQLAQHGQLLARRMFDVRSTAREVRAIYETVLNQWQ